MQKKYRGGHKNISIEIHKTLNFFTASFTVQIIITTK